MSFLVKSGPDATAQQAVNNQTAPLAFDWSQPSSDWLSDDSGDGPFGGGWSFAQASAADAPRTGRAYVGDAIHQHRTLFGRGRAVG